MYDQDLTWYYKYNYCFNPRGTGVSSKTRGAGGYILLPRIFRTNDHSETRKVAMEGYEWNESNEYQILLR